VQKEYGKKILSQVRIKTIKKLYKFRTTLCNSSNGLERLKQRCQIRDLLPGLGVSTPFWVFLPKICFFIYKFTA